MVFNSKNRKTNGINCEIKSSEENISNLTTDLVNTTTTTLNDEESVSEEINMFLDYDPNFYSPLYLYRPVNDVIGSLIVHSSSEGAGRYELGRKIGLNTRAKGGNRRVSANIQSVLKNYPFYIGQYQKMEGKYRTIKYFLKNSEPEKHMCMFNKFKELTGSPCPFKFGEVLRFPNTKLNTLRISDITMKRMLYILEILKKEKFVLTHIKMVRYIQKRDADEGYPFRIDKKSASKCLLALQRHGFCRIFNTEIVEDNVKRPFEVITIREITSVEDEAIQKAIKNACIEFAENNKIFPTGIARPFKKTEELKLTSETNEKNETNSSNKQYKNKKEAKHYEFLKKVLKQKRDLPTASEKTISSLAASYKQRKVLAISSKKKNSESVENSNAPKVTSSRMVTRSVTFNENNSMSLNKTDDISIDENDLQINATLNLKPKVPRVDLNNIIANTSAMSDKEFSAVMDSAAMSNIKQEVVNAINGELNDKVNDSSALKKRKRKKKNNGDDDITNIDSITERKKKKKFLDEIDIMSQNRKVYMRSRFTPKEKDMLILIRAVSFFLNPIHRFWLDPTVMRNIMHEYVIESRCKTASSLMAAGNRDLSRPTRMAHLQYIVKTLSSFKEMRDIRNKLPYINMQSNEAKSSIFIQAFETAFNLLFRESQSFPTIQDCDDKFDDYIKKNHLTITSSQMQDEEETFYTADFPQRSLKPNNEDEAKHCVNFNIIMSVMLHDMLAKNENSTKKLNEIDSELSFLNAMFIKQIGSKTFSESLEILHRDGLISKVRSTDRIPTCELQDAEPTLILKNQIMCSVFYRHFFNHHFHNDIIRLTQNALNRYNMNEVDETLANDPGSILLLSECLVSEDADIGYTVPNSIDDFFVSNEDKNLINTATKQLRYLENADLHIDLIQIHPKNYESIVNPQLPDFNKIIDSLTHKVPLEKIDQVLARNIDENIAELNAQYQESARIICETIEALDIVGLSEEELITKTGFEPLYLKIVVSELIKTYNIFPCGIDTRRYVLMKNASCWMIRNNKFGFFPRPWIQPSGEINILLLRWMSEAILVMIHKKPGMLVQELISNYAFVIQPIILEEILCLLEIIGCCHICAKPMKSLNKTWNSERIQRHDVRYTLPVYNGLQLFSNFFKDYLTF